jgi:hypothetical protein
VLPASAPRCAVTRRKKDDSGRPSAPSRRGDISIENSISISQRRPELRDLSSGPGGNGNSGSAALQESILTSSEDAGVPQGSEEFSRPGPMGCDSERPAPPIPCILPCDVLYPFLAPAFASLFLCPGAERILERSVSWSEAWRRNF